MVWWAGKTDLAYVYGRRGGNKFYRGKVAGENGNGAGSVRVEDAQNIVLVIVWDVFVRLRGFLGIIGWINRDEA